MSDNENTPHDLGDDSKVIALLRTADDGAVRALRARLDIEGRLAEVLARGAAEREASATVFGTDVRAVLASWSVELTPTAVRTTGHERRVVRAVADPDFFEAVVGRPHRGLEPWPDVALDIGAGPRGLVAVLSLPSRPPRGVRVVVVARLGSHALEQDFVLAADAESDGDWPVDLTAQLRLPSDGPQAAIDVIVLKVVGVDERR